MENNQKIFMLVKQKPLYEARWFHVTNTVIFNWFDWLKNGIMFVWYHCKFERLLYFGCSGVQFIIIFTESQIKCVLLLFTCPRVETGLLTFWILCSHDCFTETCIQLWEILCHAHMFRNLLGGFMVCKTDHIVLIACGMKTEWLL